MIKISMIRIVLLLVLITSTYENPLAVKSQMDKFETMIHDLSNVLANCKLREMDNIGIITHSKSRVRWSSKFLARSTVINLKDKQQRGQFAWDVYRRLLRQKLHAFIIVATSANNLRYLINELKETIWWNALAFFILIDGQTLEKGCKNSYTYLSTSWAEDLISSTYFCHHPTKGPRMYTFNPYVQKAPYPWKVVGTNTMNRNNHSWTLLEQPFRHGRTTCKDLDFDKQTDLGGFPLNVIAMQWRGFIKFNFSKPNLDLDMLNGIDGVLGRTFFKKLNATVNLLPVLKFNLSYMERVAMGEYDMMLNSLYIFNKANYSMTYPHMESGLSILTSYPAYEKAYTKILKFMNPKLMLGLLLVFAATVIILRVFAHEETMAGALEVLRVVFGVSLLNVPTKSSMRVYLFTVIVLFMLTASIFQSNLSSILTSPVRKSTIDSVEDLQKSGFPIYMNRGERNALYDDILHSRMILVDEWDCSEYVINNENVACAMDRFSSQRIALENNLYMSKHRVSTLYLAYTVRPNWPLVDKISMILNTLYERGLTKHWDDLVKTKYQHRINVAKEKLKKNDFRILNLQDLKFAFYILLFGNAVAFLVFLIEICFARYKRINKIKNMKKLPVFPFTH